MKKCIKYLNVKLPKITKILESKNLIPYQINLYSILYSTHALKNLSSLEFSPNTAQYNREEKKISSVENAFTRREERKIKTKKKKKKKLRWIYLFFCEKAFHISYFEMVNMKYTESHTLGEKWIEKYSYFPFFSVLNGKQKREKYEMKNL